MPESSSQVADAFRAFCGDERFNKFVRELDGRARQKASLRYWQERLWAEFSNTYSASLPQSAVEIAQLFGISVPESTLQWHELIEDASYVVDLVQLDSGIRYLQPRECSAPVTPHTAFSSLPCCGAAIGRILSSGQGVPLVSSHQFCVEAHGVWMTIEEAEWLDDDKSPADGPEPWVNGIPPVLPPM